MLSIFYSCHVVIKLEIFSDFPKIPKYQI